MFPEQDEDIYITPQAEHTQLITFYNDVLKHDMRVKKKKSRGCALKKFTKKNPLKTCLHQKHA